MKRTSPAGQYPWRYFTGVKSLVLLVVFLIGLFLHIYTQSIISALRSEARSVVSFYAQMIAKLADTESNIDFSFVFDEILLKTDFPLINTDVNKRPSYWKGIGIDPDDSSDEALARVEKLVRQLDREIEPVPITYQGRLLGYLYYSDSHLIGQLHWMPYIEIGIIGIFIIVGFIGFANLKRSEQRFIWVGMAKETAHQLGTPLSSLLGWLELLRQKGKTKKSDIYDEMERDLNRLNQVTQRFSQIGSKPDLKRTALQPIIAGVVDYIQVRVPQMGRKVNVQGEYRDVPDVLLNRDLFHWALENILKNSLDAMDKKEGTIRVHLFEQKNMILIDIEDNGRGMDPKDRKRVFKPGFSTKKRGWGLGLNLAKRIIEEYHNGSIYVRSSRPGTGTVMRIELPGH